MKPTCWISFSLCLAVLVSSGPGNALAEASPVTVMSPDAIRVVETYSAGDLNFGLALDSIADTTFDIALTPGSVGSLLKLTQSDINAPGGTRVDFAPATPWTGAQILGGNSAVLVGQANLTGVTAGSTVSFGVELSKTGWDAPLPSGSVDINVVANRQLTGNFSVDAGRHMVGPQTSLGNLTLNGGSATDTGATRISVHANGAAQFANGLRLSSSTAHTFNGADQTHDIAVSYTGPTGNYSVGSFALPGAGASTYTDADGNERQDFGGSWHTSAEYGNVFGAKQTFSENNEAGWDALPGDARAWLKPGSPSFQSQSYIYDQQLVETAQPVFLTTRTANTTPPTLWELARGDGPSQNERVGSLISGEIIEGSDLDLSGITLSVTGTALANRQITNGIVNLGRQMVGTGVENIVRTDDVTLRTSGADEHRTRLNLESFNLGNASLTATLADVATFNAANSSAVATLNANFERDRSIQGTGQQILNVGSSISSLENDGSGLVGETKQSNLYLGYTWANVENNSLTSNDLLIVDYATETGSRLYFNGSVQREFSTDTHTNIGYNNSVQVNSTLTPGLHNLGTQNVAAIAEGLVGEDTSEGGTSYNAKYASVAVASISASATGTLENGALTDQSVVTFSNTGSGVYKAYGILGQTTITGGQNLEYELTYGGGSASIFEAQSRTMTVNFIGNDQLPEAGDLTRISRASLSVDLYQDVDLSAIVMATNHSGYVDGSFAPRFLRKDVFQLETRFEAPAAASGSSFVAAGTNFANNGLALNNTSENTSTRFTEATKVELLDSETLGSTTVNLAFTSVDEIDPTDVAALENTATLNGTFGLEPGDEVSFASDVLSLSGLNGMLHVLQVSYDQNQAGSEGAAQLAWKYEFTLESVSQIAWINAVLGNSNISLLDLEAGTLSLGGAEPMSIGDYLASMRFAGSYADYLADSSLTSPELGAWGVDTANNHVWAVIDHNSDFVATVPEPGSLLLLILGGIPLLLRRKRGL